MVLFMLVIVSNVLLDLWEQFGRHLSVQSSLSWMGNDFFQISEKKISGFEIKSQIL